MQAASVTFLLVLDCGYYLFALLVPAPRMYSPPPCDPPSCTRTQRLPNSMDLEVSPGTGCKASLFSTSCTRRACNERRDVGPTQTLKLPKLMRVCTGRGCCVFMVG